MTPSAWPVPIVFCSPRIGESLMPVQVKLTLLVALLISNIAVAGSPWSQPVGRSTDSRDADLVAALIQRTMFNEAKEICLDQARRSDPLSDQAAKWAIRLSQIESQQRMLADRFDQQAIAAAEKPVTDLLASYPDHPRAMFLKAQAIGVAGDAARHAVVVASVNPTSSDQTDQLFIDLARVTSRVRDLVGEVDEARAAASTAADTAAEHSLTSDLRRLLQQSLIDVVSMTLLQTELFPPGGRDHIAAANKAQRAADQALRQLPADTAARVEIERLRVQAILRSGQYDRAASQLDQLMREVGKPVPANIQALQIRLDIARDRWQDAHRSILQYRRSNGLSADKSIEMDLAQLEFMLASEDTGVGTWIEQIERRHGPFARRRAEAISLAKLRSSGTTQLVDASIIAAQGQDWLRRGEPKRAGELLAAAARAERSPDRAIAHASQAAAALVAADQKVDAARVLSEVSISKPEGKNASVAHLQAAHLYVTADPAGAGKVIEPLLLATIKQWPDSVEAEQARTWLIDLLRRQDRIIEAAKTATAIPAANVNQQTMKLAAELWLQAVRDSEPETIHQIGRDFLDAFGPLVQQAPTSRNAFQSAAAFVLDEDLLAGIQASDTSNDDFPAQLLAFRKTSGDATLPTPPAEFADDTAWRLMRDGRRNRQLRRRNALTIQNWQSEPSLDQMERLIWLNNVNGAVEMAGILSRQSTSPGKTLEGAARLLGSSEDRAAMMEAVALWDQLAAGIAKGTPTWHRAKIQAIKLLSASGRREEAIKRAKFVLLTTPPGDAQTRLQYESLTVRSATQP